jgi:hypothetical protein
MNRTTSNTSLNRRIRGLYREWSKVHDKRPRILYHYTDAQGLLGMLNTKRLWATNSRFMNDPTEVDYAARVVRDTALEQEAEYPSNLFKSVNRGISEVLEVYERNNDEYIACFCEEGDLLSQWRGYGAVGGGYALGFDARRLGLSEYQTIEAPEPVLRRVLYDHKKQKHFVRRFVKLLLDWETLRNKGAGTKLRAIDSDDQAWHLFNWFTSECLNCFKDPAYAEEREWRVIQYGRNTAAEKFVTTHFRASRNRIVEYVEVDLSKSNGKDTPLPVKVIRYGPTLDPKVTVRALSLLRTSIGGDNRIIIKRSGVPFSG